jgi:hypothetical protein
MSDQIDKVRSLHNVLIDSKNGYEQALEDAGKQGMTELFQAMIKLRSDDIAAVGKLLPPEVAASNDGTVLTVVHKTIMTVMSLFNGLNEKILPGLIDGEKRIVSYYDDALTVADGKSKDVLTSRRALAQQKIEEMERLVAQA